MRSLSPSAYLSVCIRVSLTIHPSPMCWSYGHRIAAAERLQLASEVARMVSSIQFRHTTAVGSGSSRLRQAASVSVEPARCVLVYNSVIDPVTRTGEPIRDSFVVSERRWVVLTRLYEDGTNTRPSTAARPMTRIETFVRIEPARGSSPKFLREWRRDVVERVVIPAWDVGMTAHTRELENRLVALASSVKAHV